MVSTLSPLAVRDDKDDLDHDLDTLRRGLQVASLEQELAQARTALRERTRELALARSAQWLLQATLDATSDGIVTLRFSDSALHYNIAFVEMWGIAEDCLEMLDEETLTRLQMAQVRDPAALRAMIVRRRSDPGSEARDLVELLDGRVLERRVHPKRLHGLTVGVVVTYKDITEAHRAAEQRQREQATLRALLDAIPDPIFFKSPEGIYRGCNQAFAELLGLPPEQILGRVDRELIDRPWAEAVEAVDRNILATLAPSRREEWREYKDGRRELFETVKAPFHDGEGRLLGILGIGRSITQRLHPGHAPETAGTTLPAVPGLAERQGARVLLVEDHELNRELATIVLAEAGFGVDVAPNGRIACEKVRTGHYDVVLMDMQMPVMDGVTATREIRRMPGRQGLPILALTANTMPQDRERCMEAGMNDFIVKPSDPDALLAALVRWIPARRGSAAEPAAERGNAWTGAPSAATAAGWV
jgi:PAS domain S-box-containing protein